MWVWSGRPPTKLPRQGPTTAGPIPYSRHILRASNPEPSAPRHRADLHGSRSAGRDARRHLDARGTGDISPRAGGADARTDPGAVPPGPVPPRPVPARAVPARPVPVASPGAVWAVGFFRQRCARRDRRIWDGTRHTPCAQSNCSEAKSADDSGRGHNLFKIHHAPPVQITIERTREPSPFSSSKRTDERGQKAASTGGLKTTSKLDSPTRQRHGCELCTDGARLASASTVRTVAASGKSVLIFLLPFNSLTRSVHRGDAER